MQSSLIRVYYNHMKSGQVGYLPLLLVAPEGFDENPIGWRCGALDPDPSQALRSTSSGVP